MNYKVDKDSETGLWVAFTEDHPGTFFGYGNTKEGAVENLKEEVEFALNGGYNLK